MELMSDEHGIKAHIQVQSQQVQDILEKHLYRLKEGFVQQGLNLNEIQVSVNSGKNSGLNLFSEQQPHAQPQTSNTAATKESPESIADEIMARPHVHEGLISLHI
jgi:flagellar hook-length control protein FliK